MKAERKLATGRLITLLVNNEERSLVVEERETLLDVLREKFFLTS